MPFSALLVELASAGGFHANMRAARPARDLGRLLLVSSFIYLMCLTCAGASSRRAALRRSRARLQRHRDVHHRPLTDEQKADQNLQFMMSLYRSAAEPDGRPRQHRKFGSNTVRLLKPSASSVTYLPASTGEFKPRPPKFLQEIC